MSLDASGGEIWRELRKNLSPTFSSGKLKSMMIPMDDVSDRMVQVVEERRKQNNGIVDITDILQRFALEAISRCTFGIDVDLYENPEGNEIVKNGRSAVENGLKSNNWIETIFFQLFFHFPGMHSSTPLLKKN